MVEALEGYLIKEKSQGRAWSGLTGDSNKRYFKVQQIEGGGEWALCYYKNRSDADIRGWIYLHDVKEISEEQDIIRVKSAARTLLLTAQTRAEHRLWVVGIAKLCPHALIKLERDAHLVELRDSPSSPGCRKLKTADPAYNDKPQHLNMDLGQRKAHKTHDKAQRNGQSIVDELGRRAVDLDQSYQVEGKKGWLREREHPKQVRQSDEAMGRNDNPDETWGTKRLSNNGRKNRDRMGGKSPSEQSPSIKDRDASQRRSCNREGKHIGQNTIDLGLERSYNTVHKLEGSRKERKRRSKQEAGVERREPHDGENMTGSLCGVGAEESKDARKPKWEEENMDESKKLSSRGSCNETNLSNHQISSSTSTNGHMHSLPCSQRGRLSSLDKSKGEHLGNGGRNQEEEMEEILQPPETSCYISRQGTSATFQLHRHISAGSVGDVDITDLPPRPKSFLVNTTPDLEEGVDGSIKSANNGLFEGTTKEGNMGNSDHIQEHQDRDLIASSGAAPSPKTNIKWRRRSAADLKWDNNQGLPKSKGKHCAEERFIRPDAQRPIDLSESEEEGEESLDLEVEKQKRRANAAILALETAAKHADEEMPMFLSHKIQPWGQRDSRSIKKKEALSLQACAPLSERPVPTKPSQKGRKGSYPTRMVPPNLPPPSKKKEAHPAAIPDDNFINEDWDKETKAGLAVLRSSNTSRGNRTTELLQSVHTTVTLSSANHVPDHQWLTDDFDG